VRATTKLRSLFASGRIAVAPGAYDGLTARLVEQAGFPAIYASGDGVVVSISPRAQESILVTISPAQSGGTTRITISHTTTKS